MEPAEVQETTTPSFLRRGLPFDCGSLPIQPNQVMKIKTLPVSLVPAAMLLAMVVAASQPSARSADDEKLVKIVANDTLKFSVTEIVASPGQKIHVQLKNEGTMPKDGMGHNWILLDSEGEAATYAMTAISARDAAYQPKALASHVLASIQLLDPRRSATSPSVRQPSQAGTLTYAPARG